MRTVPCTKDLDLAVAILWTIYCSRNRALYDKMLLSINDTMVHVNDLQQQLANLRRRHATVHTNDTDITLVTRREYSIASHERLHCKFSSFLIVATDIQTGLIVVDGV